MQIIHLTYPITHKITDCKVVLALGFFDGVHLGHQHLIRRAKEEAQKQQLPLMVMTFDRHPSEIYAGKTDFRYIDSLEEKAAKMQALGVNYLVVAHFTEGFSHLSGQEFVDQVIIKLQATVVVAGFDYTYGPKEIANMANLPKFAAGRFKIVTISKQTFQGKKIGSTEIRQAIQAGKMDLATELLGRHYLMSGVVEHGKRNGHRLGFPTANLKVNPKKVIPKIGVYATKTLVNGHWYDSMTSVGYNVSIDQERKIYIESNLFDFDQNIYGQKIVIKWYQYTRGEIKFNSLTELKHQLERDQQQIKAYFAQQSKSTN